MGSIVIGAVSGRPVRPATRTVGLAFSDVVDHAERVPELADRIERSGASGVSIPIGRADWTAFPWPAHPESWSAGVRASGRDYVADAIDGIGARPEGSRPTVTAVVDVFVEGWIARDPLVAGVAADGRPSSLVASVSQLRSGAVGDRIVELVGEVADRYRPDAVSLTELFLDTYTFGDDDLADYRATTGAVDWPRRAGGTIDVSAPSIARWRASAVTELAGRAAGAARARGVRLEVDVRASWDGPHRDPGLDGQDYAALLDVVDGLTVWGYVGLDGHRPEDLERVTRELGPATLPRSVVSVGMWADRGVIEPHKLSAALEAAARGGATAVSVVPAALLTDGHWRALERAWR